MYKKFFCIALFLVMLASMTCIAASEDISADTDALANVEEIEMQSTQADEDLSEDYNNDMLADESNTNTNKLDPNLVANVETNDAYVTVTSTVKENATGTISIQVTNLNDDTFKLNSSTVDIVNGTATWGEMIAFEKGDYVVDIAYSGDNNYNAKTIHKVFEITKHTPEFYVEIIKNDQFVTIAAVVNQNPTGNVTFRVKSFDEENFTEYATIELENGTAIWADQIPFNKGDYVAFTTYSGDDNYFKSGNTQTFTIEKEIPDFNVLITINEFLITLNATLPMDANGNVAIYIKNLDEENYTEFAKVEVKNGTAIWSDFVPFNKGDYMVDAIYSGDENYFEALNKQTFTILKQVPNMFIDSTVNGANITLKITLPENATGVVTLTNNQTGEIKNVTLNATSIEFNEVLQQGYNVFLIDYSGDDYYFGIGNTFVEDYQIETILSTKDTVTVTYLNTAKIIVTLDLSKYPGNITADGENITIFVNNKTYTGTLENNTVTIKIVASYADKFASNNYTANVTFEGNNILKNASTSFVLVVKKGTPKLSASTKTFKVSAKTKKYTIILKNHKNKVMKNAKVTIRINGKNFKATTNENGKATFKITNLKKRATYQALVKYNSSKYYNEVSKKVKIIVKK